MVLDFSAVTEAPGSKATREQLARLLHRYHTAKGYAAGKRILEVGCGAGLGLGYLASAAKFVVGGDLTEKLLHMATVHYDASIPLVCLDGQKLPFSEASFDLIVMFEAIYYLKSASDFVVESKRVLSQNGTLLIGSVNKDWHGLAPSSLSTRYFSALELRDLLGKAGFAAVELHAAFPATPQNWRHRARSALRRGAVALGILPKTLKGRELLKRLFYGQMRPMPAEITDDMAELYPLVPINPDVPVENFKIIYAVGML